MSEPSPAALTWPEGVARRILGEVDSTNAEALRQAAAGLAAPTWFLAHRQLAGRGRRGHGWVDPAGNFAATLLMFPHGDIAGAAQRSFVAALALDDALGQVCGPRGQLALKWPNDVLLNGGKVAGILLETASMAGRPAPLAIGIGVNLIAAPAPGQMRDGAVPPVSVAGETGFEVTPEAFLALLAPAFAAREAQLAAGGFGAIRTAWLARAARLGQTITVRHGATVEEGRFEGIDAGGALLLRTSAGCKAVAAADVHFG